MSKDELSNMPLFTLIRVILSLLAGYVITRTIIMPDQEWDDDKEIQFMLPGILTTLHPARGHWPAAAVLPF
jgi:hypothetical protein